MTSTPAYENVPADIPMALTLEEAAARLEVNTAYFRTTMTKLNGTDQDLRAPQQPGERARKYDIDKLDAWKQAGMPVPKDPLRTPQPTPQARTVTATATRKDTHWIVDLPDLGQGTQAESLRNVHRLAHALAVDKLGLAPQDVAIDLTINLPGDDAQKWADAKDREREANEAARQASKLSREVVQNLRAQGMTLEDISAVLGVSVSRVQQLSQGTR